MILHDMIEEHQSYLMHYPLMKQDTTSNQYRVNESESSNLLIF